MRGVKYFTAQDLACGYNLRNIENIFQNYNEDTEYEDINKIIELYNIEKYFNNKLYLNTWSAKDIEKYSAIVKTFIKKISLYIQKIDNKNFIEKYKELDLDYYEDFWELLVKYKIYKNISKEIFKDFLDNVHPLLHSLLSCQKIVDYFGQEIRDYLLKHPNTAEILLSKYELDEKHEIHFPKILNSSDKERILCDYIDSTEPNLNYLRLISNLQSNRDRIMIKPRTLLKAQKRAELEESRVFDGNKGIYMETFVGFSDLQNEEIVIKNDDKKMTFSYSENWIKNNLDYPTLLNNFIYLFEFVDLQMRILLVNKFNKMSVSERFMFMRSKDAYIKGISFKYYDIISFMQIIAYNKLLLKMNIRLESIVEWFFSGYLEKEFNASNFKILMPSEQSNFLEKCTMIMPAVEGVLKQFIMFVQDGEIDFELLDIQSEHLIYKNIPSLVNKKYIYGTGDVFSIVANLLFSDQVGLGYYSKREISHKNLFEVLKNEKLIMEDCYPYQKDKIDWLIENGYLVVNQENNIIFLNEMIIIVLRELYYNEVISYWSYPEEYRKSIDILLEKKIVEFEDTLFSRPEQNYINYFLNKAQYNNGLDLRNMYSHSQPYGNENMLIHEQNYMYFLRMLVLFVIKINDDFCLAETIDKS